MMSVDNSASLNADIAKSWSRIAPFWPLKNLIAVNPVAGFETLRFEDALTQAKAYFQQPDMPLRMQEVNRESIKWLQAFFDEGQATLSMPLRHKGLLGSTLSLFRFDRRLHDDDTQKTTWLAGLPKQAEGVIAESLRYLGIAAPEREQFLTLMLTTLPGWAAHIQYRTSWADADDAAHPHSVTQAEYLAFRLTLTCLLWPEAKELLRWHRKALETADATYTYHTVLLNETQYREQLMAMLPPAQAPRQTERADAQLVFCIDVRSEPFRRALEAQGRYETYGFAGFFGLPVAINDAVSGNTYASCPVLLKPAYTITEHPKTAKAACEQGHQRLQGLKKLYQSLKYTFTTPFSLVETLGLPGGLWMGLRSLSPNGAASLQSALKKSINPDYAVRPDTRVLPLAQQVSFAAGALKTMGLTRNFAPLVVLCGHGSTTENNAYATALDCGACGGRHGAPNARILAAILNSDAVRDELALQNIQIPDDTIFLAAEHNTTTDEVTLYPDHIRPASAAQLYKLEKDLQQARTENSLWRSSEMGVRTNRRQAAQATATRAKDWAQVRPEWGLARNAAFIVGPRWLTKDINLEGRSFLHSYDWEQDETSTALTTILTAPMVVAQWINSQYFFSTLDNVAFGAGSKVTKNITGKIGVMQGNASDLMHGLPLQSVFKADDEAYHKPVRLTVVVYAPKEKIDAIILQHEILQKLFGNGWVHLICYNPADQKKYQLRRDFFWGSLS